MFQTIPLGDVIADPTNPRRKVDQDKVAFKELQDSVKAVGILQPLLVRKDDNGGYVVIAGHRRLAAAQALKLKTIPAVVNKAMSESEIAEAQLIENLQRVDLDPVEEATGYFRLVELGMKADDLGKRVGRPKTHVQERLKLLKLPAKILARVKAGEMSVTEATGLLVLEDRKDMARAVELILDDGYSVTRAAILVQQANESEVRKAKVEKLAEEGGWQLLLAPGYSLPEEAKKWKLLQGYEGMGLTGEQLVEHRTLGELHGVVMRVRQGNTQADEYSTSPAATKKALGLASTRSEPDLVKREQNRRQRVEKEHLREYVSGTLLRGRAKVSARTMSDLAFEAAYSDSDERAGNLAATFLGCETPPGKAAERPYRWGSTWLREYASVSRMQCDRAFLALIAAKADLYGATMFNDAVLKPSGFERIDWEAEA